jgi:isoleucyl-tRNA synthetase
MCLCSIILWKRSEGTLILCDGGLTIRTQYADKAFRVLVDAYVTDADGTGIVHQAPAFGDDDHRVLLAHGVMSAEEMPPCPIDDGGRFTSEVSDFAGQHVKV